MRRTLVILLNIVVVVGLIIPIEIDEFAVSSGTRYASAASLDGATDTVEATGFTKRSKVKKKRRQDRRDKREKERKKDREKANDKRKGNGKKNRNRQDQSQPKELPSGRLPGALTVASPPGKPNPEDRYIVVLDRNAGDPEQTSSDLARATGNVVPTHIYENVINGFAAVIPDDSLATVRNDPRVEDVVPDIVVHIDAQTLPTGINRIDADTNPTAKIDGNDDRVDVDVAVVDTAGNDSHPDLNVYRWTNCTDSPVDSDDDGHGTHVGGTIGALDNNVGVVGVAPGARLWNVRVLSEGWGYFSWIICGVDFVTEHANEIEVANLSLGGDGTDSSCQNDHFHAAFCRAVAAGVTVVVAAGNETDDAAFHTPAAYNEVITVSALADSDGKPGGMGQSTGSGRDDSLATFSNYGADVDIAAPGVSILSTIPGGYARYSGTSMAAPHVAGAAALYKANHSGATPAQVKAALLNTRENIALDNDRDGIDEGVLSIGGAFDPNPPPEPDPDPGPDPAPPPPDDDFSAPTVQWQAPVGNDQEFVTSGGTVALRAAASDDVAVDRVEFWLYSWASESWVLFGTDYAAPYQSSINASSLDLGSNYISADAYDASGNWDYQVISIYNSGEPTVAPDSDDKPKKHKNVKKAKKGKKHKNSKKKGKRKGRR